MPTTPRRPHGATVRAIREIRNLTPAELARRLGVYVSYVSNIEAGRRRPAGLVDQLAAALDAPAEIITAQIPAVAFLRHLRGVTAADLARSVGITPSRLARIEDGADRPDEALTRAIAVRLGVNPAALAPHPDLAVPAA